MAFVRCHASLEPACKQTSRIYALVLLGVNSTDWEEVNVRLSLLGGHGLFPRQVKQELDWLDLSSTPVAMPYLGVETVVKGRQLLNTFRRSWRCCKGTSSAARCASCNSRMTEGRCIWLTAYMSFLRAA